MSDSISRIDEMLNNTQLIICDIIFSFTVETESKSLEN